MSDVDAVIELLERWRDASGMGRVRIGVDATRTIAALPADRKRALAAEVARRVAPQLVPAIEAETGDLSGEQVSAVIDLLRRADRDQLDDVIDALRTGEVGGALDLVEDAVSIIAPPDPATDDLLADIAEPDTDELLDDELEIAPDGTITVDEAAVRARLEEEAAARAARWQDTSRTVSSAPAYRAPDLDFGSSDEPLDLPDPTVEEVAPLEERLDELPGRVAIAAAASEVPQEPTRRTAQAPRPSGAPALAPGPVTAVLAAITATPDGYRRRRAALAAIREGRLAAAEVAPVVRTFDRPTDRTWVAGAALDAGLVTVAQLDDLDLPVAARARLAARAG